MLGRDDDARKPAADPHAVNPDQHEPRVPGGQPDEPDVHPDHPNKPFRTPSKNKTHPAPEIGSDGLRKK